MSAISLSAQKKAQAMRRGRLHHLSTLIAHARSRSGIIPLPASLARVALRATGLLGIAPLMNEQFLIADRDFELNTSKAQRLLNWAPTRSNSETLIDEYDSFRESATRSKSRQFRSIFSVLGRFNHSQQGSFQSSAHGDTQ